MAARAYPLISIENEVDLALRRMDLSDSGPKPNYSWANDSSWDKNSYIEGALLNKPVMIYLLNFEKIPKLSSDACP